MSKSSKYVWVITRSLNDYNQDGDYFVTAFYERPDVEQVMNILSCDLKTAEHLVKGRGGRMNTEDEWYHITKIKFGVLYTRKG